HEAATCNASAGRWRMAGQKRWFSSSWTCRARPSRPLRRRREANVPGADAETIERLVAWYVEFRKNTRAETVAIALATKRERGSALNGHPGYGFKLRGSKGRRTKVPNPKEQQVMKWIVEQRQAGWTLQTPRAHTRRP